MLKITRWSPDTCECIVEYTWDDSVPDDQRVHAFHRVISKCAAHVDLLDQDVYNAVYDENPRKNMAEAQLLADFPAKLGMTIVDPDGSTHLVLKPNAYRYRFVGSHPRQIELTVPSLSVAEKQQHQNWCDKQLGKGRAKVL